MNLNKKSILNMSQTFSTQAIFVLMAGIFAAIGCSEPIDDIDYVQPHYVEKSLLTGEWAYKQTITDSAPEVAVGFVGLEGSLEKVKWKITKHLLIAYRSHEAIPGLDEDSTLEGGEYEGDPVAVFPITSHFDIIRGYSTTTGEQTNTITENTTDRPWYEREYMRVAWGSAPSTRGPVDIGLGFMAMAYDYIRETETFDPDQLQLTENYIQITQQAVVSDGGMTCYYSYNSRNCGAGEARLRLSFKKLDEADEYAPRSYKDLVEFKEDDGRHLRSLYLGVPLDRPTEGKEFHCTPELIDFLNARTDVRSDYTYEDCDEVNYDQFGRFGFFRSERWRYDRELGGGHDEHREFHAAIHNIWADPIVTIDGVKQEKPIAERTPKPVIYYLNDGFPDDLLHVAGEMSHDWDGPFMGAVTAAKNMDEAGVRQLLRDSSSIPDWRFLPGDTHAQGSMFLILRNRCSVPGVLNYLQTGVEANEAEQLLDSIEPVVAASGAGLVARLGDLESKLKRGNLPSVCAGLMNRSRAMGLDNVFSWEQVGDIRYNMLNWINEDQPSGPLGYGPSAVDRETGQILSGTANMYGAAVDRSARSAADIVRAMNEDLELGALLAGKNYEDWLDTQVSFGEMPMEMTEEMSMGLNARFGNFDVEDTYGSYHFDDGRLNPVELERQIHERLHNPLPGDPMFSASKAPIDEGQRRIDALKQNPAIRGRLLSNENIEILRPLFGLEPDDDLPEELKEQAMNLSLDPAEFRQFQEERYKYFADNNMYLAEFLDDSIIGQALAMKGMDPEEVFKTLREEIFRAVALHEIGHTVGMTHNFEGSNDALNYPDEFWRIRGEQDPSEWRDARIAEQRYTTIMEYGSRFNSDTKGLGKYDHAAIKFAYGHHTENFDSSVNVSSRLNFEVFANGYERIPDLLGGDFRNIGKRTDRSIDDQTSDIRSGLVENTSKFLENPNRPASEYWYSREVPYGYCFDSFRGNIRCQVWDEGAKFTETVRAAIQNYWNYYVFNNYRRGRSSSSFINGYFARQARLQWFLTTYFRYFYFYQQWDIGLRSDLEQASLIGLNFINQVLGTPEPGPHCLDNDTNQYVPFAYASDELQANCQQVDVPLGTGRGHILEYNDDFLPTIEYIGSYYDKANVLSYLMDTSTSFFRITDEGDSRAFSIGYYRVFRDELIDLLKNIMFSWLGEETGEAYSSYVMADGVVPKALVAAEAFDQSPERMAGMPQVQAPLGYNIVFRSLLFASVYNTSTYDSELDFDEYLAITEKGSGDDRTYPDGWEVATYVNPLSFTVYEAGQTRDGKSISFELLNKATEFVNTVWQPAADAVEADPDDLLAQSQFESAQRQLGKYNDLIGDLRMLRSNVDFGSD